MTCFKYFYLFFEKYLHVTKKLRYLQLIKEVNGLCMGCAGKPVRPMLLKKNKLMNMEQQNTEPPMNEYGLEITYFILGLILTSLPYYRPDWVGYWITILGVPMMGYAFFCYIRDDKEKKEVREHLKKEFMDSVNKNSKIL